MHTKVRIGGEEKSALLHVRGEPAGEGGDADVVIEAEALSAERMRLRVGRRLIDVHVVRTSDGTWVWHDGRARLVPKEDGGATRRNKRDRGPMVVTPPMPSTVIRVLVEVGQPVEVSAPLVIVSAMKMETTLRAPHAGIVSAIHTQPGAAVRPGEILIDVTPAP
jgi:3-methylcrotonyl-CoA carboxylase alpha subunit